MKQCFSRKMSSKPPCETPWRPFKLHPPSVRATQPTVLSGSLAAAWISDTPSSAALLLLLLHSPPSLVGDQSQSLGQAMPLELGMLNRYTKAQHTHKAPPEAGALLLQMPSHAILFPCHPAQGTLERPRHSRGPVQEHSPN